MVDDDTLTKDTPEDNNVFVLILSTGAVLIGRFLSTVRSDNTFEMERVARIYQHDSGDDNESDTTFSIGGAYTAICDHWKEYVINENEVVAYAYPNRQIYDLYKDWLDQNF